MAETYIKVKGVWKYLYRAVDKEGKTVDFLLTAKRDRAAAKRFFDRAMRNNGIPEKIAMDKIAMDKIAMDKIAMDKIAMDKNGASKTAIDEINCSRAAPILVRQIKYLNNIVEQDHRAI